jgi:beta-1,3-galactosyltransferase 1
MFFLVKFVLKCDDDSFINIPNLVYTLNGGVLPAANLDLSFNTNFEFEDEIYFESPVSETDSLLLGYVHHDVSPVSDTKSKG